MEMVQNENLPSRLSGLILNGLHHVIQRMQVTGNENMQSLRDKPSKIRPGAAYSRILEIQLPYLLTLLALYSGGRIEDLYVKLCLLLRDDVALEFSCHILLL